MMDRTGRGPYISLATKPGFQFRITITPDQDSGDFIYRIDEYGDRVQPVSGAASTRDAAKMAAEAWIDRFLACQREIESYDYPEHPCR